MREAPRYLPECGAAYGGPRSTHEEEALQTFSADARLARRVGRQIWDTVLKIHSKKRSYKNTRNKKGWLVPLDLAKVDELLESCSPDVLPLETGWLSKWLDSVAVYPDSRSHKCCFWQSPPKTALRLKKASDSRFILK